jgi:hypothetical protein
MSRMRAADRICLACRVTTLSQYNPDPLVLDDTARSSRGQACQRASLATTLVQAGDLDQAISHSLVILPDLGATLTSGRVLQRLRLVREAVGAAGAAEFCDRFDLDACAADNASRDAFASESAFMQRFDAYTSGYRCAVVRPGP